MAKAEKMLFYSILLKNVSCMSQVLVDKVASAEKLDLCNLSFIC